jgi:hypothetical protein
MPDPAPFAEVDELQEGIRQALHELAGAVTTVANLEGVPEDTRTGLIEREIAQARGKIRELRTRERMALDQAVRSIESQAQDAEPPIWSGAGRRQQMGDPRRPDQVQETILSQLVKSNTLAALADAQPDVLRHRLRVALRTDDRATIAAIRDLALRHLMATGTPCEARDLEPDLPAPRRYLMQSELGVCYKGYDHNLGPLLDAVTAADEMGLSPEARSARRMVEAGMHLRRPLDLAAWAGSDRLLQAIVQRLGDV